MQRTSSPSPETTDPFTLTSSAFDEGGSIPVRHSCDGDDVSPELRWSSVPAGTAALVLIVDDPDANGFVHWLVLDLPASSTGLREDVGSQPGPPQQGTNSFGSAGYRGPCPPSGTHRYAFTLTALSEPIELPGEPRASEARRAMEGRIVGEATLTANYTRAR